MGSTEPFMYGNRFEVRAAANIGCLQSVFELLVDGAIASLRRAESEGLRAAGIHGAAGIKRNGVDVRRRPAERGALLFYDFVADAAVRDFRRRSAERGLNDGIDFDGRTRRNEIGRASCRERV